MTTPEVAEYLGIDAGAVRKLVQRGVLHPEKLTPRVRMYQRAEVEEYATKRKPWGYPRGRPRPRKPAKEGDDADG